MKRENMRRLLGLAHECQAMGWNALVKADAELLLGRTGSGAEEARAEKLAEEARGHFKDAVALLEEVSSDQWKTLASGISATALTTAH